MPQALVRTPGLSLSGRESTPPLSALTAVTGFVGIAERGPISVPQRIESWGEYLEVHGARIDCGHLPDAVYAFFLNGGERCYVVRVADMEPPVEEEDASCARFDPLAIARLPVTPSSTPLQDRNDAETLRVEAIDHGSWGSRIRFAIRRESSRDEDLTALRQDVDSSATVLPLDSIVDIEPGATISITSARDPFVRGSHQVDTVDASAGTITLTDPTGATYEKGSVVSGRGFQLRVEFDDQVEIFDGLSMNPDHSRYFAHAINGDSDLTDYVERRSAGHSILVRVEHVLDSGTGAARFKPVDRPTPVLDGDVEFLSLEGGGDGFTFAHVELLDAGGTPSVVLYAEGESLRGTAANLRVEARPFETTTALPVLAPRDLVVVEDAGGFQPLDGLTLSFTGGGGITTTETQLIATIDAQNGLQTAAYSSDFPIESNASVAGRFDILVYEPDQLEPIETHRNLSGDPADGARYFRTVLTDESARLCPEDPGAGIVLMPPVGIGEMAGGKDPGTIDYRHYTGYEANGDYFAAPGLTAETRVGLAALEETEDVSLVAIPDLSRIETPETNFVRAQKDLLYHCSRTGDRFALLDPRSSEAASEIGTWPLNFADPRFAKNGALYFPWVLGAFEGELRVVPPCGFVAGVMAASDRANGVGKAPANENVKGAVGLSESVGREEQDALNPAGVNCIRKFEDGQIRLFGARTMSRLALHLYVNTRRLLLGLKKSLRTNLLWATFEPNSRQLWKRIEASVATQLSKLVAGGATAGTRAEDSFYVKCAEETNPSEVVEAGEVVTEIGIALDVPAEFIVLTARKSPESLSIVEEDL